MLVIFIGLVLCVHSGEYRCEGQTYDTADIINDNAQYSSNNKYIAVVNEAYALDYVSAHVDGLSDVRVSNVLDEMDMYIFITDNPSALASVANLRSTEYVECDGEVKDEDADKLHSAILLFSISTIDGLDCPNTIVLDDMKEYNCEDFCSTTNQPCDQVLDNCHLLEAKPSIVSCVTTGRDVFWSTQDNERTYDMLCTCEILESDGVNFVTPGPTPAMTTTSTVTPTMDPTTTAIPTARPTFKPVTTTTREPTGGPTPTCQYVQIQGWEYCVRTEEAGIPIDPCLPSNPPENCKVYQLVANTNELIQCDKEVKQETITLDADYDTTVLGREDEFLAECNEAYNPQGVECLSVVKGSVDLTLEGPPNNLALVTADIVTNGLDLPTFDKMGVLITTTTTTTTTKEPAPTAPTINYEMVGAFYCAPGYSTGEKDVGKAIWMFSVRLANTLDPQSCANQAFSRNRECSPYFQVGYPLGCACIRKNAFCNFQMAEDTEENMPVPMMYHITNTADSPQITANLNSFLAKMDKEEHAEPKLEKAHSTNVQSHNTPPYWQLFAGSFLFALCLSFVVYYRRRKVANAELSLDILPSELSQSTI